MVPTPVHQVSVYANQMPVVFFDVPFKKQGVLMSGAVCIWYLPDGMHFGIERHSQKL